MAMNKNKFNNRGFGLIEVLISAVLLIIIVGSVIGLSRTIVRNDIVSTERTQAFNLLRQQFEKEIAIRNDNWENGINWSTGLGVKPQSQTLNNVTYNYEIYRTDLAGSQIDNAFDIPMAGSNFNSEAVKITIKISWSDASKNYWVEDAMILTNWKPQL